MPDSNMKWNEIQEGIKRCEKCKEEGICEVRCPDDRIPTSGPQNVKLLFVSEAPPLNTRYYFYHENSNDRLRNSLFEILRCDLSYEISTINDFIAAGFYLLPTVKCPSARTGRNAAPPGKVIKLCAERHLKREIEYINPDGVCLLGRTALQGFLTLRNLWDVQTHDPREVGKTLSEAAGKELEVKILDKSTKFMISYWPTKRHHRFHEISEHIRMLIEIIGF
ncbi:MAG: uracil-DNA glycosylase family protein [Methanophagales archaeon]|nr:uracil-DNA glycosylase family protein [Methanophagales archaeon]